MTLDINVLGRRTLLAAAAAAPLIGRSARAQRFGWHPDGSPDFGVPAALATPQPVPSGE